MQPQLCTGDLAHCRNPDVMDRQRATRIFKFKYARPINCGLEPGPVMKGCVVITQHGMCSTRAQAEFVVGSEGHLRPLKIDADAV